MINGISDSTTFAAQQALGGAQTTTGSASAPSLLGNVASLLGMSTDDLITSLKGGTSMSDLASQKGISRDDLLAAITQGLQNSQNAASQPTDIATLAAKIADQKGLPGHHRHHQGSGAASGEADLQQKVADLSAALGMSSDQLVSALQSGLASTGSTPGYGVSASLLQGLQFDQLA